MGEGVVKDSFREASAIHCLLRIAKFMRIWIVENNFSVCGDGVAETMRREISRIYFIISHILSTPTRFTVFFGHLKRKVANETWNFEFPLPKYPSRNRS